MPTSEIQPPYDSSRIYELPLKEVYADEDFNCRGVIDATDVIELARDIAKNGLTEPIIVQPWNSAARPDKFFRIVAGYRRYKAHVLNGAARIKAIIREGLDELEARMINLSENIHRKDLNMKQEAHAIDHFRIGGWTEKQVAERVQKSRGWVQVRFMLLELPEDIQDEAAAGFINQQQIRDLVAMHSMEEKYKYVRLIKDKKLLGKKRDVKPEHTRAKNERRARGQQEIFDMQDLLRELNNGKNDFTTRALGWAAGEISDLEFHRDIQEREKKKGNYTYDIPLGLDENRAPQTHVERVLS